MKTEQMVMGALVALLCAAGLWHARWLARETVKGQWLTRRLGADRALWTLRALLVLGITFGILLATNIIRPVRW